MPSVPLPPAPGPDDTVEKAGDLSNWIAGQGQGFITLLVLFAITAVVVSMMKRPFVRGLVVGGLILVIIVMATN